MNYYSHFKEIVKVKIEDLANAGEIPPGLELSAVSAEAPRDSSHGDIAINAALVLAKQARMKPRDIADRLAAQLADESEISSVDVAGPGFINVSLHVNFWGARLHEILKAGTAYGDSRLGDGETVNVEYVSANPTGPLHVGHGRGAVFGDALATLLEKAGYSVIREYYINDAGAQIDSLARSLHWRYREACGETLGEIPEGLYPGDYVADAAQLLKTRDGDKWVDFPEPEWLPALRDFSIDAMMTLIRDDLVEIGIAHEVFLSERTLHDSGRIDQALQRLVDRGVIYEGVLDPPKGKVPDDWEPRPQTLFRASDFGDDIDRPLRKSDGSWTYFAADIAYHLDKVERGARSLIDVWGADHGGYVKRVQAALSALTDDTATLDVKLCSMVRVLDGGEPVRMSKRAGDFVTLRDVIDAVGRDVVRFIMLTRRNDAPLDFDLAAVTEQSRDNPVFYVQYAHARACSIKRRLVESFEDIDVENIDWPSVEFGRLTDPGETALIKRLASWPQLVETAALAHEPHRVAFYLAEVAAVFHALWNKGNENAQMRFVLPDDRGLSIARVGLVQAVAHVIASGLDVMGVTPVEEMR